MSIIFNSSATTGTNQWQWKTTSGLTSVSTPRMTTNGLLVFLDAANPKSYVNGQSTWKDISGNGYDLLLTGLTAGVRPTFSGDNYGYINFPQTGTSYTWAERPQSFPLLTELTVEIWVKFNQPVSANTWVISTKYPGSNRLNFSIGNNNGGGTPNTNPLFICGGRYVSNNWINTLPGIIPSAGEWYQLVYSFDGYNNNFYVNSKLQSSLIDSTTQLISTGLRIARNGVFDTQTRSYFTDMSASVVRIYNRSLSDEEISNNYQSLRYRYYQNIPPIDYILDSYPNAVCAFSVRKLRSSYSGPSMKLIRSSDNVTQDIGFVGKELDVDAIKSFLTGNTIGYVNTWYDQSGNGNNATGTTGNYPSINRASYIGDMYSLLFDSTYNNLLILKNNVTTARSIFMVLNPYDSDGYGGNYGASILGFNDTSYNYLGGINGQWLYSSSPTTIRNGINYINSYPTDFINTYKYVGVLTSRYITLLHTSSTGRFNRISSNGSGSQYKSWYGRMSEIIVYSGDQTTNRLTIEKNISEYYSIFPNS